MTKRAALEVAIADDPDDAAAYSVYADWLISEGDPLGEPIAHACRLADTPADKKLARAHAKHFAAHRAYLAGDLDDDPQTADTGWSRGFVREARIETAEDLSTLLAAPVGRFVTRLSLFDHDVLQQLRKTKVKPPLRVLAVSAPPDKRAKVDWLWAALPYLERLELVGPVTLGKIAMPAGRELIVRDADRRLIAELDAARWPALEILDLSISDLEWPLPLRLIDRATKLRELSIHAHYAPEDALQKLIDTLLDGKTLANLTELELSAFNWKVEGTLGEQIADHAARFAHLDVFDITVGRKVPAAKLAVLRELVKPTKRPFANSRTLELT